MIFKDVHIESVRRHEKREMYIVKLLIQIEEGEVLQNISNFDVGGR